MLQHPVRSHGRAFFSTARPRVRPDISHHLSDLSSILNATVAAATALTSRSSGCLPRQQWRSNRTKSSGPAAAGLAKTGKKLKMDLLHTPNALARAIRETGVWDGKSLDRRLAEEKSTPRKIGRPKRLMGEKDGTSKTATIPQIPETTTKDGKKRAVKGDKSRVQITNEDLVKDMVDYLKPTLARHKGCDLVSVNPGAGAWTKALHEAVQPRSHLLLEPDESTYRPFLQPLLDQDNVRLVPRSGIIWEDLDAILTPEYLPNQVEIQKGPLADDPPRNDTLLVSMNLAMFPKKRFATFQSVSRMVLFQLLQTIRTATLYQKYGQVRMLIWVPDDEKFGVLPRVLSSRRRMAIEGELTTEYIAEVCGRDVAAEDELTAAKAGAGGGPGGRTVDRWPQMEIESARLCRLRMQKLGMATPSGRATTVMNALDTWAAAHSPSYQSGVSMWTMRDAVSGKGVATEAELETLKKARDNGTLPTSDPGHARLKALEQYYINLGSAFNHAIDYIKEQDAIIEVYKAAAAAATNDSSMADEAAALLAKAQQLEAEYDAIDATVARYRKEYALTARDAVHTLTRQPPELGPVMTWDRRPYEPLPAAAADFFPNVACALLDIQPKAPHPLLRSMGPGTDNAGDIFDMILGVMSDGMASRVQKQIATLWPGANEGVLPRCGTLTDPARGGIPLQGIGALTNRCLNEEQLMQVLEEFMKWPFRPSHVEMVGRLGNDEYSEDDEMYIKGNAQWHSP